ncbi:MAG TPA: hypothetical protein P5533_03890 [Candidatus Cloacimonadota bacterium]|nr:hypothetical protein [Candidatus Cloacimonadota bacterium]
MKTRLIGFIVLHMFVSLIFGGTQQFSGEVGSAKHEIVDSLLAVDELSGSIYYQQNDMTQGVDCKTLFLHVQEMVATRAGTKSCNPITNSLLQTPQRFIISLKE